MTTAHGLSAATDSPVEARLARRAAAEAVGTGALVMVVVGSGVQATRPTGDVGLQLLANSTAPVLGLAVLIAVLGPVFGAHLNPAVTLVAAWTERKSHPGLRLLEPGAYIAAQVIGAAAGAVLANLMFGLPPVQLSTHARSGGSLWLAEVVATAGLVLVIFGLARAGRENWAPLAVAAYIGAAYWFTSSTCFANPAVTIGPRPVGHLRGHLPGLGSRLHLRPARGALAGDVLLLALFGRWLPRAADVVLPHPSPGSSDAPDLDTSVSWSPAERTPAP